MFRKVMVTVVVLKLTWFAQRAIPRNLRGPLKGIYHKLLGTVYLHCGRPLPLGETAKAKGRRLREGFFDKYCPGHGLDVGYGGDLLCQNCVGWDIEHGDAQLLKDVGDSTFDFVYSSHTLEHMVNPEIALRNWWRVLKVGGYLILYLPERNLYEKTTTLPSRWNPDHSHFFLLDKDEPPDTIGLIPLIEQTLENFEIVYAKICGEGHTITDPDVHSNGEYSMEMVIRKLG